jgi:hypothetical protein
MVVYLPIFSMILMLVLSITTSVAYANCTDIGFDITCYNNQGQDVGHICTRACSRWLFFGPSCRPCHTSIFGTKSVFALDCQRRFLNATYWQPSTIGGGFVANLRHHRDSHIHFVACKDFS